MSKTKLKKYLQSLPQEHLIQVILDLYDARKDAKEYLEFFMNPDVSAALEKSKKDLYRIYFTPQGRARAKASVKDGSDIVNGFIKLDINPESVSDLLLYHVEVMMSRLVLRHLSRETAWASAVTLFRKAAEYIVSFNLRNVADRRIDKIIDYTQYAPPYLRVGERMKNELNELNYYES